jgi:tellurite resistance-related uncharacterized protein
MPFQTSATLRNNMIGQYETTVGTAPKLQLRTGAQPADCAAADSGTLIAEITLPSDWLTAASAGAVSKNGTWAGTAVATGTIAHYRIKDSGGTTTHEQGNVGTSGTDLVLDSNVVNSIGQNVTITGWTRTQGGA